MRSPIVLLTGRDMGRDDTETPHLVEALTGLGFPAEILPWDETPSGGWGSVPLVVVRSTWDYTQDREGFLEVLAGIDAETRLVNPLPAMRWSSHKGYLVELAKAGVPVVPTRIFRVGDRPDSFEGTVVVKPAVGAGGRGAVRATGEAATHALAELLGTGDAVVQPMIASVLEKGETSLVYLGGAFSHAVRKVPAAGEFRVHAYLGGSVLPHEPSTAELEVAAAALARAPGELAYARVDLVGTDHGPVVMELELLEPELFLTRGAVVDRCAKVLAGLVSPSWWSDGAGDRRHPPAR